jgi:hypothetical protein
MSILNKIGHVFKIVFTDGDKLAVAVSPVVGFLFPGWGTLFNLVAGSIAKAEAILNPATTTTGNGPEKKAFVMQDAENLFLQYEQMSGNVMDRDSFIDGVVMAMNATKETR